METFVKIVKLQLLILNERLINIKEAVEKACRSLNVAAPEHIKGVRGLSSINKIPELLEKGILRAKYNLTIFKDGTIRFDATNAPITHFKPSEIDVPIEKLKILGYIHDINGSPLQNPNQICELKVQDVIIPKSCAEYSFKHLNS